MEWFKELFIFIWAVINNWAGYATGGIIVALIWLRSTLSNKQITKSQGMALTGIFLFLAGFQAWKEQYDRVQANGAELQADPEAFYTPGNPFIFDAPLRMRLSWLCHGGVARQPLPKGKLYVLPSIDVPTQERMISDWKPVFADYVTNNSIREASVVFPERRALITVDGPTLTKDLLKEITDAKKFVFAIGAVRFRDNLGRHEAHACYWLSHIAYGGKLGFILNWSECVDYVNQIDIK